MPACAFDLSRTIYFSLRNIVLVLFCRSGYINQSKTFPIGLVSGLFSVSTCFICKIAE